MSVIGRSINCVILMKRLSYLKSSVPDSVLCRRNVLTSLRHTENKTLKESSTLS